MHEMRADARDLVDLAEEEDSRRACAAAACAPRPPLVCGPAAIPLAPPVCVLVVVGRVVVVEANAGTASRQCRWRPPTSPCRAACGRSGPDVTSIGDTELRNRGFLTKKKSALEVVRSCARLLLVLHNNELAPFPLEIQIVTVEASYRTTAVKLPTVRVGRLLCALSFVRMHVF